MNIADKTNAANVAKVDAAGKVSVGDGSGPLTVDGTTTSREPPLTEAVHFAAFVNTSSGCVTLATPPAVKALVVKTLRLNAYQIDASSGQYYVHFAVGACGGSQANVFYGHEMTTKIDEFSFEPGLIIPAGQSLVATPSAPSGTFLFTEVSGEGYKTAASSVPAPAAAANVGPTEATAKPPGPSR